MSRTLEGKRILVVEDEYQLAFELEEFLIEHGATVIGPVATVKAALNLVAEEVLDGAVLDVNLRDGLAYPIADALVERLVPLIFATGYSKRCIAQPYNELPLCEKPVDLPKLLRVLTSAIAAYA